MATKVTRVQNRTTHGARKSHSHILRPASQAVTGPDTFNCLHMRLPAYHANATSSGGVADAVLSRSRGTQYCSYLRAA